MSALLGYISPAQAKVVLSAKDKDGNPIKVTKPLPDPNMSVLGHCILSLSFYGLLIAYIAVATLEFVNMPPTTTQKLDDADKFPALTVRIAVECKTGTCGDVKLSVNYSNFHKSPCFAPPSGAPMRGVVAFSNSGAVRTAVPITNGAVVEYEIPKATSATAATPTDYVYAPLCFSKQESLKLADAPDGAQLPLSMLQVGFNGLSSAAALMVVDVFYDAAGSGEMPSRGGGEQQQQSIVTRYVNVEDDNSVRVLPISAVVESVEDEIEHVSPGAEVIQFEGFRPSGGSQRSDVLISMNSLVTHRERKQLRSAWELLFGIGSAFETLMGFMPLLLPLYATLFMADKNWMSDLVKKYGRKKNKGGDDGGVEESQSSTSKYEMKDVTLPDRDPEQTVHVQSVDVKSFP